MDNTIDNTKTLLHVILSALKFVYGWRVFKGPEERLPNYSITRSLSLIISFTRIETQQGRNK